MQIRTNLKSGAQWYTIQAGDTLRKISDKFYKTPNKWQKLCTANQLPDCNKIKAGKSLWIPD